MKHHNALKHGLWCPYFIIYRRIFSLETRFNCRPWFYHRYWTLISAHATNININYVLSFNPQICRSNNMERSLFTRLFQGFGDAGQISNAISITKQYRMHPEICSFPNKYFYGNRLQSVNTEHSSNFLLMPYTVFSLDCKQSNTSSVHYYNQYEAEFILSLLKVMIRHADPKAYSYGIITPYAAQTRSIKKLLG